MTVSAGPSPLAICRRNDVEAIGARSNLLLLLVAGVTIAVSGMVWILVARSRAGPLGRIVQRLRVGSERVTSASSQIAASGQTLAERSAQQAASVEETSASIQEMESLANRNADSAA